MRRPPILPAMVLLLLTAAMATAGTRAQALQRVARSVGKALERDDQKTVKLVRRSKEKLGKSLEVDLSEALTKDSRIDGVDDAAKYSVQMEYRTAGRRVSLQVTLLNGRGNSVSKFSVNFEIEPPQDE